jgi:hypothetical protein
MIVVIVILYKVIMKIFESMLSLISIAVAVSALVIPPDDSPQRLNKRISCYCDVNDEPCETADGTYVYKINN